MPRFETHHSDAGRVKAFHAGLFGWKIRPMPGAEGMGDQLPEATQCGSAGSRTAGPMRHLGARGGTMTFGVEDCDGHHAWALANGGAEALPPMDYPGIGRVAYVDDGEGNIVGLITPAQGEN